MNFTSKLQQVKILLFTNKMYNTWLLNHIFLLTMGTKEEEKRRKKLIFHVEMLTTYQLMGLHPHTTKTYTEADIMDHFTMFSQQNTSWPLLSQHLLM